MPYYESGTTVDFSTANVVANTEYIYSGLAGLYGYQPVPSKTTINIDSLGASLSTIMANLTSKIHANYAKMSWNVQPDGTITDFVFGLAYTVRYAVTFADIYVSLPTDFKVLLNQLGMVSGPNDALVINGFTSYLLYGATQGGVSYTTEIQFKSSPWDVAPPSDADLAQQLISAGNIDNALSQFVSQYVQEGYQIGLRDYNVTAHANPIPRNPTQPQFYYTTATLSFSYTSDKPIPEFEGGIQSLQIIIIIAVIAAFIIGGVLLVDVFNNLTTTHTTTTKNMVWTNPNDYPVTVHTPDGDITIPAHGTYTTTQTIDTTKPPDYWGWVIPIVALIGAGAGVYIILQLIPKHREK